MKCLFHADQSVTSLKDTTEGWDSLGSLKAHSKDTARSHSTHHRHQSTRAHTGETLQLTPAAAAAAMQEG